MRRICAWCPFARIKTWLLARVGIRVSHGICPRCLARLTGA